MEPTPPTPRPPGRLVQVLIALWFAAVAVDGLPLWEQGRQRLDPVLDRTGLWQGPWDLFAPNVDKVNTRVGASIYYADGQTAQWRSPDWQLLTGVERFLQFREMEWMDGIRLNSNRGAWDSFAAYLARTVLHPEAATAPVVRVTLTRFWATIPSPWEAQLRVEPHLLFNGTQTFHEWRPEDGSPQ